MRVGQSIWHSARTDADNSEISKYANPTEIRTRFNYFTVMPATSRGYAEVMKYGEDVDNTWTAIANDQAFHGKINVGDLFWLDGEKPPKANQITDDYGYAQSATSVVKNVAYNNLTISITLTRNKEQVK